MSDDTRDTVQELLRRMAEGDHARTAELFAEPIDWQLNWPAEGHPAVPWIRPRSDPGPRQVCDLVGVITSVRG
ncbi:hypothetical protein OHA77_38135 [Streptosporangium sp. NBC_01639]|uniref:hypothetical protein n=1 Tax=Streptosporangium sp. NBC_01639 TaxID=2975948 RepID=UPI00386CAF55|nr:hypothetical protein OHA77_38135 [Streptosporangium sp. NBC_01639]